MGCDCRGDIFDKDSCAAWPLGVRHAARRVFEKWLKCGQSSFEKWLKCERGLLFRGELARASAKNIRRKHGAVEYRGIRLWACVPLWSAATQAMR